MANKNYLKGRRKEYKIVKEYKELGYDIVQRSASSKSVVDVWCVDKERKVITLIQAKPDSMSVNAKGKLLRNNAWLNGVFVVEFVVV